MIKVRGIGSEERLADLKKRFRLLEGERKVWWWWQWRWNATVWLLWTSPCECFFAQSFFEATTWTVKENADEKRRLEEENKKLRRVMSSVLFSSLLLLVPGISSVTFSQFSFPTLFLAWNAFLSFLSAFLVSFVPHCSLLFWLFLFCISPLCLHRFFFSILSPSLFLLRPAPPLLRLFLHSFLIAFSCLVSSRASRLSHRFSCI